MALKVILGGEHRGLAAPGATERGRRAPLAAAEL